MKKLFILLSIISFTYTTKAQVGIGTTSPLADLDIRTSNAASPTAYAGIAIPQVDALPSSGNRAGQMVFLTTNKKYYCYGGSTWNDLSIQTNTAGDVKYGFQTGDHNGWVLLNGRAKTTLTATQQAAATALSIGDNLPNMADRTIVGVSGTKELNVPGGNTNASVTIAQNQLPNVTLTTSSGGAHVHQAGVSNNYSISLLPLGVALLAAASNSNDTSSNGSHSHTIPLNGGVAQQSLNIQDPYIPMYTFIYLGN